MLQQIVSVLGVLVPLAAGLLLYVQTRRGQRDDITAAGVERLHRSAQEVLHAALAERGIERSLAATGERIERTDGELRRLEREMAALREGLPREFVRREDWIAAQARTERKLDAIGDQLHSIVQRLPAA